MGPNPLNLNECLCNGGFIWRSLDNQCIRDCSKKADQYATMIDSVSIDKC